MLLDPKQWNPAMLGAAILANNTRPNFGHAVGRGFGDYGMAMMQSQEFQQKLKEYQLREDEYRRQEEARKQLEATISGLPEDQQVYARMAPKEWAAARLKPPERRFAKAADGLNRWVDDGAPVFPGVQVPPPEPEDTFGKAKDLRGEFDQASKEFVKINDAYGRVMESAKEPSHAGDMALIFNFMKMLDPGSTVREGEYASAQNASNVPGRVRAMYNNLMTNNGMLDAPQRGDFLKRSGMLYNGAMDRFGNVQKRYRGLAQMFKIPEEEVVYDLGTYPRWGDSPSEPPPAPPPGALSELQRAAEEELARRKAQGPRG